MSIYRIVHAQHVQDQFKSGDQCKKRFNFCRTIPPKTGSSTHHPYRVEAERLHKLICIASGVTSVSDTPGEDDDMENTEIGEEFETTDLDEKGDDRSGEDRKHTTETLTDDIPTTQPLTQQDTQPISPILISSSNISTSGLTVAVDNMHMTSSSPSPSISSASEPATPMHKSAKHGRGKNTRTHARASSPVASAPVSTYRVQAKRKDDNDNNNIDTPATKIRRQTATAIDTLVTNNNTRADAADSFQRMILITMQQERQESREREERREQREADYRRERELMRQEERRREEMRLEAQERQHREFMTAIFAMVAKPSAPSQPHS
jgi:hypothetical protein